MAVYDIGSAIKLYTSAAFTDAETGVAVDPTTVRFQTRDPDGTVTSYVYGTDPEVVKDATGEYHLVVRPSKAGTWRWRLEALDASGDAMVAEERSFDVDPEVVT